MQEEEEIILTDDHHALGNLVGDISEGMLNCSYNDHDVMELWLSKELNNTFKGLDTWQLRKFQGLYSTSVCERINPEDPYDFEKILWVLYERCGGWPTDWLCNYAKLETLDKNGEYREVLTHLPKVTMDSLVKEVWDSVGGRPELDESTVTGIFDNYVANNKETLKQQPSQDAGDDHTGILTLYLP